MQKITINNVEFCDFGTNNYSNGMRLITCYPAPKNIVSDVLSGKYEGVFLNPSAPCGEEFFGVLGTAEQYKKFQERQREAQIATELIAFYGGFDGYMKASNQDVDAIRAKSNEIRAAFKYWWE